MPLRSTALSLILRDGFSPALNPAVDKTTCTLRTDTDIAKSRDLAHKTRVVISAIKQIRTYTQVYFFLCQHVYINKLGCELAYR